MNLDNQYFEYESALLPLDRNIYSNTLYSIVLTEQADLSYNFLKNNKCNGSKNCCRKITLDYRCFINRCFST